MDEEEERKERWGNTIEEEDTEEDELDRGMKKLMKKTGSIQYHKKEDLPTKEELMENFRLDKIDKAYDEKWD